MRIMTCHIGCISPRRQALERRPLQTFQTICHRLSIVSLIACDLSIITQSAFQKLSHRHAVRDEVRGGFLETLSLGPQPQSGQSFREVSWKP